MMIVLILCKIFLSLYFDDAVVSVLFLYGFYLSFRINFPWFFVFLTKRKQKQNFKIKFNYSNDEDKLNLLNFLNK